MMVTEPKKAADAMTLCDASNVVPLVSNTATFNSVTPQRTPKHCVPVEEGGHELLRPRNRESIYSIGIVLVCLSLFSRSKGFRSLIECIVGSNQTSILPSEEVSSVMNDLSQRTCERVPVSEGGFDLYSINSRAHYFHNSRQYGYYRHTRLLQYFYGRGAVAFA